MKKILFVLTIFVALASNATEYESHNFKNGLEAIEKKDFRGALDFLKKEVADNPKNGYAYFWLASISMYNDKFHSEIENRGDVFKFALNMSDALNYYRDALKYIPKNDRGYRSKAYNQRSELYLFMRDTISALDDLSASIKILPQNPEVFKARANIYFSQGKIKLADADYNKIISINPNDVVGYMGIGRNRIAQGKWDEAIEKFNRVEKIDPNYSYVYLLRAESYIGKKDYEKAADDLISALKKDDKDAYYTIFKFDKDVIAKVIEKVKAESEKSPNDSKWPMCNAIIHDQIGEYKEAIKYNQQAYKIEPSVPVLDMLSKQYLRDFQWENSLSCVERLLESDPHDLKKVFLKAYLLKGLGRPQEAIPLMNEYLAENNNDALCFYLRGGANAQLGNYDDAIEDLTTAIDLNPTYAHSYLMRGDMYKKKNKDSYANSDYNKVLSLEAPSKNYCCSYFACLGLGDTTKAIEIMEDVLKRNPTLWGNNYDAACLYSRMNRNSEALLYLETAIKMGYKSHLRFDFDYYFDDFRKRADFKALSDKYKDLMREDDF